MMSKRALLSSLAAGALAAGLSITGHAADREQIRIVGSSTVYPFSSYVAEEFGAVTQYPTPVVESTGSGGGMKIFCEGDGLDTADITNASRRMKPSEFRRCSDNGVTNISEFMIGSDGIAIAQANGNEDMSLTLEQLALATLAKVPQDGELVTNPYDNWSEIDPALPDREITIYGPPTTSGTRDSFEDLGLEPGAERLGGYPDDYSTVRDDGAFVPSGENDNLIVQKIQNDRASIGVFGYSFLEENTDSIKAIPLDGVEPTPETISEHQYPVSRTMFFYTKNSHVDRVAGMREYVELFLSEQMIGARGLLKGQGLIPLPERRREAARDRLEGLEQLELADLE